MAADLRDNDDPIERQLEAALQSTEDDAARYHLREALQLRIAEKTESPDN